MTDGTDLITPPTTHPPLRPPTGALSPPSAGHSPVPYLFGSLAAMFGVIALALLLLICSYWKLSGFLDGGDANNQNSDSKPAGENSTKPTTVLEEQFVVIMAGDHNPSFLANPIAGRGGITVENRDERSEEDEEKKSSSLETKGEKY